MASAQLRLDAPLPARVAFGPFVYDLGTGELWRGDSAVHLRPQAQQVLELLLRRPGALVSRDELRSALSGGASFGAFDQALNDAIREIRIALGDPAAAPTYVETLPRRGYRFRAEVAAELRGPRDAVPGSPAPPTAQARTNRRRPMAVAALALAVAWLLAPATPRRIRLVVVPIVGVGGDRSRQLADGLTEELISQLGTLAPQSLGVIARTTAFRYQNTTRPASSIGRELGVDYLVEGALRVEGGRLRADMRLISAASDTTLWSQTLDRGVGDHLTLQADIGFAVSRRVGTALGPPVRRATPPLPPAQAAQLLRARSLWASREPAKLRESADQIEALLRVAPEHAPALALLAQVLLTLADTTPLEREGLRTRAAELADAALRSDDAVAEAHAARGLLAMLGTGGWRFPEAEASLARALTLNPSDAAARQWLSSVLRFRGRHAEALREAQEALHLDPLSPSVAHNLANALLYGGDINGAIGQYRHVQALAPGFAPAWRGEARALETAGRFEEALRAVRRAQELAPADPEYAADAVFCLARLGRVAEAGEALTRMPTRGWPYSRAVATLALGRREAALELIEQAVSERDPQFRLAGIDPRLRELRGSGRFRKLLERAGLVDD